MEFNPLDFGIVSQVKRLFNDQVQNEAGGFVWKVDEMNQLRRFLCLGSENGSYYIKPRELGLQNVNSIKELIERGRGPEAVKEIEMFSVEGRAAKQGPILLALALCARSSDPATKHAAYEALGKVCRIPTHLFEFIENVEKLGRESKSGSGWGRGLRRAVGQWYNQFAENPDKLAMLVTKYRNRHGWTHTDVLRLAHLKPCNDQVSVIVKYVVKGLQKTKNYYTNEGTVHKTLEFLEAVDDVRFAKVASADTESMVRQIRKYNLVWEHIPTEFLKEICIWKQLLQNMPLTAMIRNLGRMTSMDLLKVGSDEEIIVISKLLDDVALKKARIHPFNVLVAMVTYLKGKGDKGKLEWKPNKNIADALDNAFYLSFKFVEPTNKRYCLAIDVSGSMTWGGVNGTEVLNPRQASAALAMTTLRTERNCDIIGFSDRLVPLKIRKNMKMDQVIQVIQSVPMGATDCAQPMLDAMNRGKMYDVFIVYTDCETWVGRVHPAQALRYYRTKMGIGKAKLIVCAMTSNQFSLADPMDPGMLDMAGFDSAGPQVISNFIDERL